MHQTIPIRRNNGYQSRSFNLFAILTLVLLSPSTFHNNANVVPLASASAIAHPIMAARLGGVKSKRGGGGGGEKGFSVASITETKASASSSSSAATIVAEDPTDEAVEATATTSTSTTKATTTTSDGVATTPSSETQPSSTTVTTKTTATSSNPINQLFTYVKDSCANFKNGLVQMNTDHKRCNTLREKQRHHAKTVLGTPRPRGIKGIQTGGITYEEYDFLRKGLMDRNKLFAVVVVSLCLPNYFVYYLWSFPDMMPTPFLKGKDGGEVSRERCHAVISTMLDMEKGARVAPWSSKLNPFGRKATERAMERLGSLTALGCGTMEEYGANGSGGMKLVAKKLQSQIYTSDPPSKQQRLLAGNILPKQMMKGLTKAIGADPLNKGASPFGIGAVKHIESVTLADEFLVDQKIELDSITSTLLAEACSARLIGGPGWTDAERREALATWLNEMEIGPREVVASKDGGSLYYNGNLARAALMCYNAVDGTRDSRADSSLLRVMYQGQKSEPLILASN